MYCVNCQCASCKSIWAAAGGQDRVAKEVVRLVKKSAEKGMTTSELKRYSRILRTLANDAAGLLFDQLVAEGVLIEHMFKPTSGRGKSRHVFLFAQVSQ